MAAQIPVKLTCDQCFTSILTPEQIRSVLNQFGGVFASIAEFCARDLIGPGHTVTEADLRERVLDVAGITDVTTQNKLIECLKAAGIVFAS